MLSGAWDEEKPAREVWTFKKYRCKKYKELCGRAWDRKQPGADIASEVPCRIQPFESLVSASLLAADQMVTANCYFPHPKGANNNDEFLKYYKYVKIILHFIQLSFII